MAFRPNCFQDSRLKPLGHSSVINARRSTRAALAGLQPHEAGTLEPAAGIEPATHPLQGDRSAKLSYTGILKK